MSKAKKKNIRSDISGDKLKMIDKLVTALSDTLSKEQCLAYDGSARRTARKPTTINHSKLPSVARGI